jgi:hypothetical protein
LDAEVSKACNLIGGSQAAIMVIGRAPIEAALEAATGRSM